MNHLLILETIEMIFNKVFFHKKAFIKSFLSFYVKKHLDTVSFKKMIGDVIFVSIDNRRNDTEEN